MQKRIERWLTYWLAKPISWAVFGLWLAVKYGWFGAAWCVNQVRERWTTWRAKRQAEDKPAIYAELPFAAPTRRASKREAFRKA